MKLRFSNSIFNCSDKYDEKSSKSRLNLFCLPSMKKRSAILYVLCVMLIVWLINSFLDTELCSRVINDEERLTNNKDEFIRLKDDLNDLNLLNNKNLEDVNNQNEQLLNKLERSSPLIFVGGVPRSGTTLMRAMLDAHPDIRCGEETRLIPRMIDLRNNWLNAPTEHERLNNAGITQDIIDSAVSAFILEIIRQHGKPAEHLCNKDPLVLRHSIYVKEKLFPNSKFILMIRDGRASVHSMITRQVTIKGFDLTNWADCLTKWNRMIEAMYDQCTELGSEICLPVYYEQLVLHPEKMMKEILEFLDIPWNDAVINHEKFIGDEISLSKVEFSSDQVVKPVNLEALTSWVGKIPDNVVLNMDVLAPMLLKLGYDPFANPPKYGEADLKIKENTKDIKKNSEYWKEMSKKYSIRV